MPTDAQNTSKVRPLIDSVPKAGVPLGTVAPVPAPPKKEARRSEEKWGKAVMDRGYTIVPSLLLWGQQRLGLSPAQLIVLLQIISHWWEPDKNPYPSKKTIAIRLDRSERQIQRYLTDLELAGFIRRVSRYLPSGGQTSNGYQLDGLVRKLKKIEPEFRKAVEENRERRAEVETPIRNRRAKRGGTPSPFS